MHRAYDRRHRRPSAAPDYRLAERFLGDAIRQLVYDGVVTPRWIGTSGRFWYVKDGPDGKAFLIADAARGNRAPAFDHEKLAAAVTKVAGRSYTARNLPFERLRFSESDRALYAEGGGVVVNCDLAAYTCTRATALLDDETLQQTGQTRPYAEGDPPPRADVPSPDSTFTAYVQNHDLWVRNLKTGEAMQLSRDGEHHYDYATPLPSPLLMVQQGKEDVIQTPAVFWSPDSRKIATYVMDQRNFPRLTITQSAPKDQFRPKYFSYAYPLPVDFDLPTSHLTVFDVVTRKQTRVAARPLTQLYYGGPRVEWTADSKRFSYREIERGYAHVRLRDVDAATGASRDIVDERGGPLVSTSVLVTRGFNGGREVIWSAERDGWNHFYLYDAEKGALKNQITKGEWVIRSIDHIDEANRVLYFTGAGREAGRDPDDHDRLEPGERRAGTFGASHVRFVGTHAVREIDDLAPDVRVRLVQRARLPLVDEVVGSLRVRVAPLVGDGVVTRDSRAVVGRDAVPVGVGARDERIVVDRLHLARPRRPTSHGQTR